MKKRSSVICLLLLGTLLPILMSTPVESENGWSMPIQLTNNDTTDGYPCISGDGSKIAFQSYADGDDEIFVIYSDGTGLTQLTTTDENVNDTRPSISGDGKKIAFTSTLDYLWHKVFVINSDGTGLRQLTGNNIDDTSYAPSISGDGTKIAFQSYADGDDEIFVTNYDGTGLTQLTHNTALDYNPSICSDGSKIAFMSHVDGDLEIFVVNSDGTGLRQLTFNTNQDYFPSISGDGTKIAFSSTIEGGGYEVFVVNSDGSGLTRLTNNPENDYNPSICYDGSKITFQSNIDGDYEIYVINSDGTGMQQLTNNEAYDGAPSMSSDGLKIAFTSNVDGDNEIFLVTLELQPIININLGLVPLETTTEFISESKSYFKEIGQKITSYFQEVSYGAVNVNVEILTQSNGDWFMLPESSGHYFQNDQDFYNDAITACDGVVNFTKYDYVDDNGRGIVAFIPPSDVLGGNSAMISYLKSSDGGYNTNDNTRVDLIYVQKPRFQGSNQIIRALAHEFSHFLGKLLVTFSGGTQDNWWVLPELYSPNNSPDNQKNVDSYWALMGKLSDRYLLEKVHLCSYSKEWLGWLTYKVAPKDENIEIISLPQLNYQDEIYRYVYSPAWEFMSPNYFIFELRTNSSTQSTWDTQTLDSQALAIYQVDEKIDVPFPRYDSVNLATYLTDLGQYDDPDLGLSVVLQSINEENAIISIEDYDANSLKGASLNPSGEVFSETFQHYSSEINNNAPLPDLDLHAYTSEGGHVGMNYSSGVYEINIVGAMASGDLFNGREWIYVPEDVEVEFVVCANDTEEFFELFPEVSELSDGFDTFAFSVGYYDENETRYDSTRIIANVLAGDNIIYTPTITQNPDDTYNITIAAQLDFELELNAGWNMVSFSSIPDNPSFSSIFSEVGFYQVLTWDSTSYISPTSAESGVGYWILVLEETTITIENAVPITSYEFDLPAGWSMLGSVINKVVFADDVFPGFYQLLTWDGTSYVTSTTIEPGKGYWALVLEPTTIMVGG